MNQVFILTPFPEMVRAVISESILGRSEKKERIKFHIKNLFDFADPPHRRIDVRVVPEFLNRFHARNGRRPVILVEGCLGSIE